MTFTIVDNIMDRPAPPTRETIERERTVQLQAVQSIRRKLAEIRCLGNIRTVMAQA